MSPHPAHTVLKVCGPGHGEPLGPGVLTASPRSPTCPHLEGSFAGGDVAQKPQGLSQHPTVSPGPMPGLDLGWSKVSLGPQLHLVTWRGQLWWSDCVTLLPCQLGLGRGQEGRANGGGWLCQAAASRRVPLSSWEEAGCSLTAALCPWDLGPSQGWPPAGLLPTTAHSPPPDCAPTCAEPGFLPHLGRTFTFRGTVSVCFPDPCERPQEVTAEGATTHHGTCCPQRKAGPDSPRHRPQEARVWAG